MKNILLVLAMFMLFVSPGAAEPPTGINLMHDVTLQMVTGDLTSSGDQYSTADSVSTADTWYVVFLKSFDINFGSDRLGNASHKYLSDVYFNISGQFRASSSTLADIAWKAQARNKNGTWIDLSDSTYIGNAGLVWSASSVAGYFTLTDNFDEVPFDFRILLRSNETDEAVGRLKSGSYVRMIFKDINWGI